jgi:hypothetical protein
MVAPNIGKHKSKFSIEHARCSMENENGFNHGHSRWGAAYYSVTSAFRLARSVDVTRIGSDGGHASGAQIETFSRLLCNAPKLFDKAGI